MQVSIKLKEVITNGCMIILIILSQREVTAANLLSSIGGAPFKDQ
jgi:hypothetical protein